MGAYLKTKTFGRPLVRTGSLFRPERLLKKTKRQKQQKALGKQISHNKQYFFQSSFQNSPQKPFSFFQISTHLSTSA